MAISAVATLIVVTVMCVSNCVTSSQWSRSKFLFSIACCLQFAAVPFVLMAMGTDCFIKYADPVATASILTLGIGLLAMMIWPNRPYD